MYKAPSFGLGMKKDLRESIESVYDINNSINEEELAEAFAIFLEENFHVEMLTEEDLDYVFEEEFPQWLEEQEKRSLMGRVLDYLPGYTSTRKELKRKAGQSVSQNLQDFAREIPNALAVSPAGKAATALRLAGQAGSAAAKRAATRAAAAKSIPKIVGAGATATTATNRSIGSNKKPTQTGYEGDLTGANKIAKQDATATAVQSDTGGPGETGVGDKIAKKSRKQVSANPKPTPRKQVRRPAPKIDYKTPVTRRGPDGTYGLTDKGRRYVARKEAQERARTAASDAKVKRTGKGELSWAKKAFTSEN